MNELWVKSIYTATEKLKCLLTSLSQRQYVRLKSHISSGSNPLAWGKRPATTNSLRPESGHKYRSILWLNPMFCMEVKFYLLHYGENIYLGSLNKGYFYLRETMYLEKGIKSARYKPGVAHESNTTTSQGATLATWWACVVRWSWKPRCRQPRYCSGLHVEQSKVMNDPVKKDYSGPSGGGVESKVDNLHPVKLLSVKKFLTVASRIWSKSKKGRDSWRRGRRRWRRSRRTSWDDHKSATDCGTVCW